MKKITYLGLTLMTCVFAMASCSDDDNAPISLDRTFDDANGLTLTVNGAPMVGKTVKVAAENGAATITLGSSFDLSEVPGLNENLAKSFPGPGVIPGEPQTVLTCALQGSPDRSTFAGKGDSRYCTFDYSGEVVDNAQTKSMSLNISNLELKNKAIAGKWNLMKYSANEDWESPEYGTVYTEPTHLVWESTAQFDFLGTPMPMSDLLKLLMSMPLLEDMTMRVPDALNALLRDITLGTDGDITASYADLNVGLATPAYLTSPKNMAQYVVDGSDKMLFFINPQAVIGVAGKAESTIPVDIDNILGNVIAQLAPMMSTGVPMHYTKTDDNLTVYLGTEILLPLLKTNVVPLLRNQELVDMIVEMVSADPDMGMLAPMLPDMIASAADVIDGTTKLEIGLNFDK